MDWQALAVYIAAFAAICSALSAGANLFNTGAFYRQLRNTTVDACVAAASALKGAVHKTMELKENKRNDILVAQILSAHEDAWAKWIVLNQTFRVAQRYNQGLREREYDPPDELSRLLSELTPNLHDPEWRPHGDQPKDIRKEVDRIVDEIHRRAGLV
jgi:hypothetical protein